MKFLAIGNDMELFGFLVFFTSVIMFCLYKNAHGCTALDARTS